MSCQYLKFLYTTITRKHLREKKQALMFIELHRFNMAEQYHCIGIKEVDDKSPLPKKKTEIERMKNNRQIRVLIKFALQAFDLFSCIVNS